MTQQLALPSVYNSSIAMLRLLQVSIRQDAAVSEKTERKWMLSIAAFLRHQNCSLADAVRMWKANVDQEFAGVEPCMICYSVIQPTHRKLPKLHCRTCRQTFHSICLYKWFRSSGKSMCPHCQTAW
jgi:E3 ubiquitin-protein ligase listerin